MSFKGISTSPRPSHSARSFSIALSSSSLTHQLVSEVSDDEEMIAAAWLQLRDADAGRKSIETYLDLPEDPICSELCFRARLHDLLGARGFSPGSVRSGYTIKRLWWTSHCSMAQVGW